LVVIAIIAILASLLLPALSQAKEKANAMMCRVNFNQLGACLTMYAEDNDGFCPYTMDPDVCSTAGCDPNFYHDWTPWAQHFRDCPSRMQFAMEYVEQTSGLDRWYEYRVSDVWKCPTLPPPKSRAPNWQSPVCDYTMNYKFATSGDIVKGNIFRRWCDAKYTAFIMEDWNTDTGSYARTAQAASWGDGFDDINTFRHRGAFHVMFFDLHVERYDRRPPGNWDAYFWTYGYWSSYGGTH